MPDDADFSEALEMANEGRFGEKGKEFIVFIGYVAFIEFIGKLVNR